MNSGKDFVIDVDCSDDVTEKALRDMHNAFRKNHPEYTDEDIAKMGKMAKENCSI